MAEPLCVVPAGERTALAGVDGEALVEVPLPFAWDKSVFALGEGRVACAHHRDGGPRCSVLEVMDLRDGVRQTWDSDEGVHITSLAIAGGRVFVGAFEGLFSLPLDDLAARPVRYEAAALADGLGVNSLVVDGDRLIALESLTNAPTFALFDLRRPLETTAVRRVPVGEEMAHDARIGGAFIVLESRTRSGRAHYDHVFLFDRVTLARVAHAHRRFARLEDDDEINPRPEHGWAGVAILDDTLVIAQGNGALFVVSCDELLRGVSVRTASTWLPTAPDQRRPAPFPGVIEQLVPVPYRRAAIAIVRDGEARSARVFIP